MVLFLCLYPYWFLPDSLILEMSKTVTQILYIVAMLLMAVYLYMFFSGHHPFSGVLLTLFFIVVAIAFQGSDILKGYSFTISIFAAASAALYYPDYFIRAGDFRFSLLIIPLLQLIMFGMGTSLNWRDFARIIKMPGAVIIGLICQFTFMPFLGYGLSRIFSFTPEIAAGIILVGSCPSGLASNVMSYLAKANLALSVTLTAFATLLAPVMTPFYMELLAGQLIEVSFMSMMMDIIRIIILPVGAGLLFNHFLHGRFVWLDKLMPILSMAGIVLIIVVITAAGQKHLLIVGPILLVTGILHCGFGYLLGYWAGRLFKMSEADCRTISLEVGCQNSGLASGLALSMGKLSTVGLMAVVFGPVMNISGSTLAQWWRNR